MARRDNAQTKRLTVVPGSDEDQGLYLQARAVDELLKELDTISRQAEIAKHNRENQPA